MLIRHSGTLTKPDDIGGTVERHVGMLFPSKMQHPADRYHTSVYSAKITTGPLLRTAFTGIG